MSSFSPASVTAALRMLLYAYPARYRTDRELQENTLRAFVVTVIPGADRGDPDLVRMYYDTNYPFFPYTGYLVYDLAVRTARRQPGRGFGELVPGERTAIIADALASDDTTSRLVKAAMLMAQVSYFAGIYDPAKGCALIDFPGMNDGFSPEEISRPDADAYLGEPDTADGNPP
ncbi:MAG TPA: hypothetical protein VMF59_03160 [Bacteroidota bacterium]|nr:hypothetical protein [Bacteroidota bacterium]